jgi:hypothetical protein
MVNVEEHLFTAIRIDGLVNMFCRENASARSDTKQRFNISRNFLCPWNSRAFAALAEIRMIWAISSIDRSSGSRSWIALCVGSSSSLRIPFLGEAVD